MSERLQKFLAGAGVASRRKAEELITSGRVKVNNAVVTELGTKVDPGRDLVTVDGKTVSAPEGRTYVLLYKPPGCVTTVSDPQGRPTALDYLRDVKARVFPVGRLDYDAEGAVLFTDDGELANRLAHPRYGHRRVYLVKVKGDPEPEQLERMRTGVRLEDGPAKALAVEVHEHAEKNVWLRLEVGEGRYHLVKRLCEAVGLPVLRLFRPEFGGVSVDGLRPGQHRPLSAAELKAMRQLVGLAPGAPAAPPARRELPKAARRHGHGPPPPKGFAAPQPRGVAGQQPKDSGAPHAKGSATARPREFAASQPREFAASQPREFAASQSSRKKFTPSPPALRAGGEGRGEGGERRRGSGAPRRTRAAAKPMGRPQRPTRRRGGR